MYIHRHFYACMITCLSNDRALKKTLSRSYVRRTIVILFTKIKKGQADIFFDEKLFVYLLATYIVQVLYVPCQLHIIITSYKLFGNLKLKKKKIISRELYFFSPETVKSVGKHTQKYFFSFFDGTWIPGNFLALTKINSLPIIISSYFLKVKLFRGAKSSCTWS